MPGMNFAYQIKRTGARSRSISVRVHGDGTVRVGAPDWVRLGEIRDVVAEHSAWINERLAAVRAVQPQYVSGTKHPYLGRSYPLEVVSGGGRPAVRFGRAGFRVVVARRDPARVREEVRKELQRWYRERAQHLLGQRLERLSARLAWLPGVPKWRVRRMRTQWGSCCETGLITLNSNLVKAPLKLIDYVILHELAHLKHHDHGARFQRLMDAHMSDWRQRRRALNALGERLLFD